MSTDAIAHKAHQGKPTTDPRPTIRGGIGGGGGRGGKNGGHGASGEAAQMRLEHVKNFSDITGGHGGKGGEGVNGNGGDGGVGGGNDFGGPPIVEGTPAKPESKVLTLGLSTVIKTLLEEEGYETVGGLFQATHADLTQARLKRGQINEVKHVLNQLPRK
ncbi:hypothetical protein B0H19DRAFT_1256843 [Mycena capillaripes]|nr:hypothetical protein B0H19DRAFT_1256843 [Mycena capillaripes]